MTRIIADSALRRQLNGLNAPVEVCDDSGRTVGHYLPEEAYKSLLYSSIDLALGQEEIARRRKEQGGRTLPEIWKSLGQP